MRSAVYAAEEDSRVVGFWSARLRYPTRRVPLKRAGSSLAGPRVNDHRKPMCVTSRGSEPYSRSFTYSHYLSFWVCMRVSHADLPLPHPLALFSSSASSRGKHHRGPREKTYLAHLPATTHRRWKCRPTGDHFSCLTSVMKRLLPSSFTLPIYRFNYRLVLARRSRSSSGKNPKLDHTATLGAI